MEYVLFGCLGIFYYSSFSPKEMILFDRIPAQFFLVLEKGPRFFFFFSDVGFVWFHLYFLFVSKKTEKEGGKTAFGFLLLL